MDPDFLETLVIHPMASLTQGKAAGLLDMENKLKYVALASLFLASFSFAFEGEGEIQIDSTAAECRSNLDSDNEVVASDTQAEKTLTIILTPSQQEDAISIYLRKQGYCPWEIHFTAARYM